MDLLNNSNNEKLENIPKFINTLYNLLQNHQLGDLISWRSDGKVVLISSAEKLAHQILPVYFKHNNYSSFVRQLNLYGFRKKRMRGEEIAFAHPMFLRDREDLLKLITRKTRAVSGSEYNKGKSSSSKTKQGEFEKILKENERLKAEHEQITSRLSSLENLVFEFARENEEIKDAYMKKKYRESSGFSRFDDEDFLESCLCKLTRVFGSSDMGTLLKQAVYQEDITDPLQQRRHHAVNIPYEQPAQTLTQSTRKMNLIQTHDMKGEHFCVQASTSEETFLSHLPAVAFPKNENKFDKHRDDSICPNLRIEKKSSIESSNSGIYTGSLDYYTSDRLPEFETNLFCGENLPSSETFECQQALTNDFSVFD